MDADRMKKKGAEKVTVAPVEDAPESQAAPTAADPVKAEPEQKAAPEPENGDTAEGDELQEVAELRVDEIKGDLDPLSKSLLDEIPNRPKRRQPQEVAPTPERPTVATTVTQDKGKLAALAGGAVAVLLGGAYLVINGRRGTGAPSAAPTPDSPPQAPAAPADGLSQLPPGVKVIG